MPKKQKIPEKYQAWIDARRRFDLSDAHIQMARELGLNPRKLDKLVNEDQEPLKDVLPTFIERLYQERFNQERPENVRSIEDMLKERREKKAERKAQREESE